MLGQVRILLGLPKFPRLPLGSRREPNRAEPSRIAPNRAEVKGRASERSGGGAAFPHSFPERRKGIFSRDCTFSSNLSNAENSKLIRTGYSRVSITREWS